MRLTGADINKVYSEQLAKLLLDGYILVVTRENGTLAQTNDDFAKVILEKDGKKYDYGFWYDGINSKVGRYVLTLTEHIRYSWWDRDAEVNNLLVEPYTYYSYNYGIYEVYKHFIFSTEEEALELYEKRKQRADYREWKNQRIINTFKVAKTNYKGFKKNVTVESLRYSYILTSKNGRKASISKRTGHFTVY